MSLFAALNVIEGKKKGGSQYSGRRGTFRSEAELIYAICS